LYTSCVLGLRPFALFNEFLLIKKKNPILLQTNRKWSIEDD
jgi:hypothetical protein